MAATCLDANTVLALVDGRLGADVRLVAEVHLASCQSCADLVAMAVASGRRPGAVEPAAGDSAPRWTKGAAIGRYVILDLVGRGGMGEVYAAYDPQLDRKVALKLLNVRQLPGGVVGIARGRLLREAKAIARLSHPNVVVVHDAGELDDQVFLAMEFVEGETLAAWLERAPRGWREIRDVFLAAGQGLAAAHEAGLVHRDFKPQNVMVSSDGSVRVMDFGLASDPGQGDGPPEGQPLVAGDDDVPPLHALTRTGMLVGTPLYMAPEQFLARGTDPRTDQFSFCVALHHALYRERPFPSESFPALLEAVVAGRVREPSQKSRAPAFLRKLLLRGLQPEPERRFPSMSALLHELRQDPGRRHRRVAMGVAAVAVAVLAVGGLQRLATRGQRLCRGADEKLAGAWELGETGARRTAVHGAFLATGRSFAEPTWQRVSELLDDYSRRWAVMYADVCEATNVRGDQSAEVLDLRMSCLEGPRGALRALTDVLARADGAVVVQAVNAAQNLPALDRCANVPLLRAVVAPPGDAATRKRVDEVRAGLAQLKALTDTGRLPEAHDKVGPLVAAARATTYSAVLAQVLEAEAILHDKSGNLVRGAATAEEAVWAALASRQDDIAIECAALLTGILGYHLGRFEEAARWDRLGQALLQRLGPGQDRAAGWLMHDRAIIRARRGDLGQALVDMQAALKLRQKALGPDHPDVALSWEGVANIKADLGDSEGALEAINHAFAIDERSYGGSNPLMAQVLGNRGEILGNLGRYREAEADLRTSIARWGESLEPDHPWYAYPLTALGKTLVADGRPRQALPFLERALRIRERAEPNPELVAETRFALARALWNAEDDRARARTLASVAADGYRKLPAFAARARPIDEWLEAHAVPVKRR